MALATRQEARLADVLLAHGPHSDHTEALMLFGRLVGEWDLDWAAYAPDGERQATERGEWIFAWVLDGRAVQDVWIVPSRARRERGSSRGEWGTTIRLYDPRLDVWLVTWNGPCNGARRTFVARPVGDEILQVGRTEEGHPMRWVFSEITDDSFTWRSFSSSDGERTWQLREEMYVTRKPRPE